MKIIILEQIALPFRLQHMNEQASIPGDSPDNISPKKNKVNLAVVVLDNEGLFLFEAGGMSLLERSVLSLREAGIERFLLVGKTGENDLNKIKLLPRLEGLDLEMATQEEMTADPAEPFLLLPANHIYTPLSVQSFVGQIQNAPQQSVIGVDEKGAKTGLYYFSKNGSAQISSIIHRVLSPPLEGSGGRKNVEVVTPAPLKRGKAHAPLPELTISNCIWLAVKDTSQKKQIDRFLRHSLYRPGDGWVSRTINRPLSTRLTFLLAKFHVHPNTITTWALLLTLVGAWFAGSGVYWMIVTGALIFQVASILDGCDGELARLSFRTTNFGNWYEQIASNIRYVIFFGALGVSAWLSTDSRIYLFAVIVMTAMAIYMLSQMIVFAWKERHEEPLRMIPETIRGEEPTTLFASIYRVWRELNKQDVMAFVAFICCVIYLYQAMFWLALLGTTATAMMVSRSVTAANAAKEGGTPNLTGKVDPLFFYLLGVIILCALVFNMDLQVVSESLAQVGNKVWLIFGTAILWVIANTLCIYTVIGRGKVKFIHLLYNQLTGDAYNTIIPMAGLGGEPYKIKHLTQWLDWHTASRSIVVDRLIHSNTGILFGALGGGLMLIFVDNIPTTYYAPLAVVCGGLTIVSIAMAWLTLSKAPSKLAGYVLKKLKIIEDYRAAPIPAGRFFLAYLFKFLGRAFALAELYVMFRIFDIVPTFIELASVAGMVSVSATLFFVIPQGMGVNESGISLAMDFLGYSAALGITFGLLRRARMIFWALFGVALHLAATVWERLKGKPAVDPAVDG
ncbi:MAG: lysylphosphatidylglycerol synthase domain-containing protein [Bacteroidota bacterium]